MTAYLILENGTTFQGEYFGKQGQVTGEIVFSTGMTGYLETITDPCYHGQIILQTFPLIGNYGIISSDLESDAISASAYIVKYPCQEPSNFRSDGDLDTFFMSKGIVGIKGIDTRALTKIIRDNGTMNGKITPHPPTPSDQEDARNHKIENAIAAVSCKQQSVVGEGQTRVALLDYGMKKSMVDALVSRGCQVHIFPHSASADDIMAINPHGVLLTSGPGNPQAPENAHIINTIRSLMDKDIPMFGISMGHLLMAIANGYKVQKMPVGHRGANQPVRCCKTGRLYITAQNHGYTVIADNPSYVNVNDGTCEGLDYGNSFSVQFNPGEGPKDTEFLYDHFMKRMVSR